MPNLDIYKPIGLEPPRPEPEPLIEQQYWRAGRLPDEIPVAYPVPPAGHVIKGFVLNYDDDQLCYRQLQSWLQISRFWYYVVGVGMVHVKDYRSVRDTMLAILNGVGHERCGEFPIPFWWYWNHLPDRYSPWCKTLFSDMKIFPRFPMRGVYFDCQPATMKAGTKPQATYAIPEDSFDLF